jgi:hypothetical protein
MVLADIFQFSGIYACTAVRERVSLSGITVVLSGAAWICRSVGGGGGGGVKGSVDEGVVEVEGEMDSSLAPQPDSAIQLRIASGSQPHRCQVERRVSYSNNWKKGTSYNEVDDLNVLNPFGHSCAMIWVEKNRYMRELGTRDLKVSIKAQMEW